MEICGGRLMFRKEDVAQFLDISDLKTSTKFMVLINEIIMLQADVKALESLVNMKYDSYAVEAAKSSIWGSTEYVELRKEILKAIAAIKTASENPEEQLKAMFKAKMRGKLS